MAAVKPFVSRVKEAMFHTCPGEPPHRDTFLAMPMHAVCEGCAAAEAEKLESPRCIANESGRAKDHCDHTSETADDTGATEWVNICCWCGRRQILAEKHGLHLTDIPL